MTNHCEQVLQQVKTAHVDLQEMTEGKEKTLSSEDIEAVKKYKLWVLRAEGNENIAGPPVADELCCQEDVFEVSFENLTRNISFKFWNIDFLSIIGFSCVFTIWNGLKNSEIGNSQNDQI